MVANNKLLRKVCSSLSFAHCHEALVIGPELMCTTKDSNVTFGYWLATPVSAYKACPFDYWTEWVRVMCRQKHSSDSSAAPITPNCAMKKILVHAAL